MSTFSDNNRLTLLGSDISVNKLTVDGAFDKAKGNASVIMNNCNYVTIKDSVFTPLNAYNGIEIGGSSTSTNKPKAITIDNCVFGGGFTNNAILVFDTAENAVINITNCTFKKLSNVLRLSNKSNAKGITVNMVNCTVEEWVEGDLAYKGLVLFQDYTSKTVEEAEASNLFGDGKIVINLTNVVTPEGKVVTAEDWSAVLGCKDENQLAYIYSNAHKGVLGYKENIYPTFNIK